MVLCFFFFKCTATTEIYTVSHTLALRDALPIWGRRGERARVARSSRARADPRRGSRALVSQLPGIRDAGDARLCVAARVSATTTFRGADRKFILLFMVMLTIAAGNTALQSVLPALRRSLRVADNNVAAAISASAPLGGR